MLSTVNSYKIWGGVGALQHNGRTLEISKLCVGQGGPVSRFQQSHHIPLHQLPGPSEAGKQLCLNIRSEAQSQRHQASHCNPSPCAYEAAMPPIPFLRGWLAKGHLYFLSPFIP